MDYECRMLKMGGSNENVSEKLASDQKKRSLREPSRQRENLLHPLVYLLIGLCVTGVVEIVPKIDSLILVPSTSMLITDNTSIAHSNTPFIAFDDIAINYISLDIYVFPRSTSVYLTLIPLCFNLLTLYVSRAYICSRIFSILRPPFYYNHAHA